MSLIDGRVIKVDAHGNFISNVLFIGGFVKSVFGRNHTLFDGLLEIERSSLDPSVITGTTNLLKRCIERTYRIQNSFASISLECGRPLGLRIKTVI